MNEARKHEMPRSARRRVVNDRVVMSHCPWLVKIGVRSWKAKSVPVGSKFAKLAVLVKAR